MSGARRPKGRHRKEREIDTAVRAGRVLAAATLTVTAAVFSYSMLPATGAPGEGDQAKRTPADTVDATIAAYEAPASRTVKVDARTEVGQERTSEHSDTVLLQIRRVAAPAGRKPATGREWFGIRARTCMHTGASRSGELGWSGWAIVTDANRSYSGRTAPWTDFPGQQYTSRGLAAGECQVGWVLIAVPRGTFRHVVEVCYRPGNPDGLTWRV
jgi:hypothetical protein